MPSDDSPAAASTPPAPEVIYYVACSLDGYISDHEGGVDWLLGYEDALEGYDAFFASIDLLLMGRKTYEQVLSWGDWPYGAKPTAVLRSSPFVPVHDKVFGVAPQPQNLREALAHHPAQRAWVVGGAQTVDLVAQAHLLTTLQMFVVPKILGSGTPLFTPAFRQLTLTPTAQIQFSSGVVQLDYSVRRSNA